MSDMRAVLNKIMEMSTPKHLPGAVAGIKIMSPEEFAQTSTEEEIDETNSPISMPSDFGPAGKVDKDSQRRHHLDKYNAALRAHPVKSYLGLSSKEADKHEKAYHAVGKGEERITQAERERRASSGVGPDGRMTQVERERRMMSQPYEVDEAKGWDDKDQAKWDAHTDKRAEADRQGSFGPLAGTKYSRYKKPINPWTGKEVDEASLPSTDKSNKVSLEKLYKRMGSGVAEVPFMIAAERDLGIDIQVASRFWFMKELNGPDHIDEATALPIQQRTLKGSELTDYLDRIRGKQDISKKTGLPKLDKKGEEKHVTLKTKQDMYKMPYVHRSSVMRYYSPSGKTYDTDLMKAEMTTRPKTLLKQNEKMKHSNGELEQFFNIGFAALVGTAVDETSGEIIVVNTCPGAGSCQIDCFARKGGFIQYEHGWLSRSKILTYLLNDPTGFTAQLNAEIADEVKAGKKGGYSVSIRWHDSGDFFSPEYMKIAFGIAESNPDAKFYAYTKIAAAALGNKPTNFIINWSEGAKPAQSAQIRAQDPDLEKTKNSRIVPEKLFWDLLKKDKDGNLDKEGVDKKGKGGRWVTAGPSETTELKKRLANAYGLSVNSILTYDEYMSKRNSIPGGMKYNVIVAPGEGDVSANDHGILGTLLLKH